MAQLLGILNLAISIYMVLIFFRIILTWFSWTGNSGLLEILSGITDPYLNWFRGLGFLRMGSLDLSPIAAIGVLSLLNRIISSIIFHGRISLGILLTLTLQIVWGLVSFILGFFIVILILRLICHLARQSVYSPFWRIVDSISQPVLYRISRMLFKGRIVGYTTGISVSIAGFLIAYFALRFLVLFLSRYLAGLQI